MADIDILTQQKNEEEYKTYLGVVALRKSLNEEIEHLGEIVEKQSETLSLINEKSFSEFSNDGAVDITDESIISIVSLMQEATFKVRLMNSLRDIVYPMTDVLTELQNQKMMVDTHHHQEDVLYQQSIVSAIENMKESVEGSLIRTLVLEYRQFTRNPVWSTFRLLNAGLIQPLAGTIGTILTGWKKTKSDTDRIVESVDKLREFMMTGQVDDRRSTLEKIIQGGLVGITGRAIGSVLGITQGAAQSAEDKAARGEEATFREDISKRFISDIIRRGRNDFGYVPDKNIETDKTLLVMFSDDGKEMQALWSITDALNRLIGKIPNIINVEPSSTTFDFSPMFRDSKERPLYITDLILDGKIEQMSDSVVDVLSLQYKASRTFFNEENKTQTNTLSIVEKILKNDLHLNDVHTDTERYSKKSLRELQGIRRTQIFQAFMTSLSTLGTLITSGLGGIVSGLKTLGATIIAALAGKKALDAVKAGGDLLLPDNRKQTTTDGQVQDNDNKKTTATKKRGKSGAVLAVAALGGLVLSGKAMGDEYSLSEISNNLQTVAEAIPIVGTDLSNVVRLEMDAKILSNKNNMLLQQAYEKMPTLKDIGGLDFSDDGIWDGIKTKISAVTDRFNVQEETTTLKSSVSDFYEKIRKSVMDASGANDFIFDPTDKTRDPLFDFKKKMSDDIFYRKEPLSKEWFDQKIGLMASDFKESPVGQTFEKIAPVIVGKADGLISSFKTDYARFGEKETYSFDPTDKTRDPLFDFKKKMSDDIFYRKEPLSREWFDQKLGILRSDFKESTVGQTADKWMEFFDKKITNIIGSAKTDYARFGEKETYSFDPTDKTRDPLFDFRKKMSDDIFYRKEPLSKEWFDQKLEASIASVKSSAIGQTADKWMETATGRGSTIGETLDKWTPILDRMATRYSEEANSYFTPTAETNQQLKQTTDAINNVLSQQPQAQEEVKKAIENGTATSNQILNDMKRLLEELNKNMKQSGSDGPPLAAQIDSFIHRTLA